MARYDRAITVFSPDGHLFQVEYALEAVRKGNAAVGVRGTDTIVLGVEKKSTAKLQDSRLGLGFGFCKTSIACLSWYLVKPRFERWEIPEECRYWPQSKPKYHPPFLGLANPEASDQRPNGLLSFNPGSQPQDVPLIGESVISTAFPFSGWSSSLRVPIFAWAGSKALPWLFIGVSTNNLPEVGDMLLSLGVVLVDPRSSGCVSSLNHELNVVPLSVRKIVNLDDHIAMACAGLKADARVLINRARIECQSHRLTVEDPVTVEYITRYIAGLQQKYTQSGGVRPFGLSTLIVGFDPYTGVPSLYQTDPSGTFSAWKANATGRNSNSMREFLEKNYKETSGQETVKLAIRALLEQLLLPLIATSLQNQHYPLPALLRSIALTSSTTNRFGWRSQSQLHVNCSELFPQAAATGGFDLADSKTVVESGGKNIEVAVMTKEHGLRQLDEAEIDAIVAEIEAEKAAAEAAKKGPPKET
ncbi:hypothetical protein TEA_024223 [Camellia sinensis var. sinensis]|uniref:Proteasome alpha-type subunits domain-containing protein n=1 Tax=Camellia sinensis var. sinensis TaxID=542762 RepID=A0A4S4DWC4_CAMSN|nr:hypothetical protein TEA_024223 [Camellia sinensis var. sinensis]